MHAGKDSWWSWLVVVAALLSQVLVGGLCLTSGIFYLIFTDNLHTSASATAWLCGLPNSLWFFSSPAASFLINKFGYRVCAFAGGLISATGLSLSFFVTDIIFLFITFGLLGGFGTGIHYTACLAAVNDYCLKYKTLATGVISLGHNLGQALYSVLILYLNSTFGWHGMCLLLGAISAHYCLFAVVMRPIPCQPESSLVGKDQKQRRGKGQNWRLLKKPSLLCFCVSSCLINIAESIYLLHLPAFSTGLQLQTGDIGTLLAVFGLANGIGKVLYSCCGQHPRVNVTMVFTISMVGVAGCMYLTPAITSVNDLLYLVASCGFLYCVTGALVNAVLLNIVGDRRFVDGAGVFQPFKGIGNLIGGPIAGAVYDRSGDYTISFYMAGTSVLVASLLMLQPILQQRAGHMPGTEIHVRVDGEVVEGQTTTGSLQDCDRNDVSQDYDQNDKCDDNECSVKLIEHVSSDGLNDRTD